MIALLLGRLAVALALGALAMAMLGRAEPARPLPLVKADFPVCVTIKPGPLGKPHRVSSGRGLVSEMS